MSANRSARSRASRTAASRSPKMTRAHIEPVDDLPEDASDDVEAGEEDVQERVNYDANLGGRRGRSRFSRTSMSRAASRKISGFDIAELREFMKEEDNILPRVPDTADFHYHWGRVRLADKDDGSNVHDKLNGRMGYEVVTADKLPPGFKLDPLTIKSGDYMGGYQYRDCVLLRCPMKNYRMWLAAAELRTQQLTAMLDAGDQAARIDGEERTDFFVEENHERSGTRREVFERADA